MERDLYRDLSVVLALNTYARCEADAKGRVVYEHFAENQLDIPPDILSRLGVMWPVAPDGSMHALSHYFLNGWSPQDPLNLTRHEGEPSLFDLIVAL